MFNKIFPKIVLLITWKNIVEPDRTHMRIQHMLFAYWIYTATDTNSDYKIGVVNSQQQWVQECAAMLRCSCCCCSVFEKEKTADSFYMLVTICNYKISKKVVIYRIRVAYVSGSFNLAVLTCNVLRSEGAALSWIRALWRNLGLFGISSLQKEVVTAMTSYVLS